MSALLAVAISKALYHNIQNFLLFLCHSFVYIGRDQQKIRTKIANWSFPPPFLSQNRDEKQRFFVVCMACIRRGLITWRVWNIFIVTLLVYVIRSVSALWIASRNCVLRTSIHTCFFLLLSQFWKYGSSCCFNRTAKRERGFWLIPFYRRK